MPEKPRDGTPPKENFEDEEGQERKEEPLRTPEEMRGEELRGFIEMHEFPKRMEIKQHSRYEIMDMEGKPIPPNTRLLYQGGDGVKMRGDTLYGEYMDDHGRAYWVKLGDADYWASRVHGYTKARPPY